MDRKHHHGALREALVEAALELLDDHGAEAVTIRATARKVGVSHAAPVNHFVDLRALLTALAIRCFEDLTRAIEATGFRERSDPREQMLAFIEAYHDYGLANPNRYRLMWRLDLLDKHDAKLKRMTDALFDLVASTVQAFGEPAGISIMSRVVAVCSVIHGYVMLRIDGNFEGYADEKTGQPRHLAIMEALLP